MVMLALMDWVRFSRVSSLLVYGLILYLIGVVCTTYGVGELSALNAIAGAYAERVPVVKITGMCIWPLVFSINS